MRGPALLGKPLLLGRRGLQCSGQSRSGAYRFIASKQLSDQIKTSLSDVKFTGSAVVGRPDIEVVLTPDQYKIRGVDISRHDASIDFPKLKSAGVRFVYAKATQGDRGQDPAFERSLKGAEAAGVDIGAYHFFEFCLAADAQFKNIRAKVPRDRRLLPLAVDVEWNMHIFGTQIVEKKPTDCSTIPNARAELIALLQMVEEYYGTRPIIYTTTAFDKNYHIFDASFEKYPLWLADFSARAKRGRGPGALGANPWTFWQVGESESLPGYPDKKFDLNVFFGNNQDYETFRTGKTNVALDAAQGKRASSIPQ